MWINWKGRGKRDLLVLEEKKKNTWKIEAENQKEKKKKKIGSVEERK